MIYETTLLQPKVGSAVVWGRETGVVGANVAEARWSSCGVTETGHKVEGKNSEGWFVAEGDSKQSTSESGDTTDPYLLGQEAGNSGVMGGPTDYL